MTILEVQNVTSGYGEVQILWDTSLKLEQGKLTSLVGSNGVGKTTLLRAIVGLLKPWQGAVTFHGQDATMSEKEAIKTHRGRELLKNKDRLSKRAGAFIAVSEHIRRRLIEQGYPE